MSDERQAPSWWHCDTHGPGNAHAWGCPECVREMRRDVESLRGHVAMLRAAVAEYLAALEGVQNPTAVGSTCRLIRAESELVRIARGESTP